MVKVSPNDGQPKNGRQKRRSRNKKNLGKKRVAVSTAKQIEVGNLEADQLINTDKSPLLLSPVRSPPFAPSDVFSLNNLGNTPKTPRAEECESESRLESLPIDLLVKILCHLHHDQLRAVFHVSQKIRKAVVIARQYHFNYTTPDRTRQEMLNATTPLPTDHWPFVGKGGRKGILIASPHTPRAPKHGPRPPSRLRYTDMKQVTAVLFQDSCFSSKCLVPSVIQKPVCKTLASNRALFYEDELCQAVAQNKLR